MFLNISQESVTVMAEGSSRSRANSPPGKEGTLLISLEINPCVFIFSTSLCTQVCLPLGYTPTQWILSKLYFAACSALFGVVWISLLSLTGLYSGLGGWLSSSKLVPSLSSQEYYLRVCNPLLPLTIVLLFCLNSWLMVCRNLDSLFPNSPNIHSDYWVSFECWYCSFHYFQILSAIYLWNMFDYI